MNRPNLSPVRLLFALIPLIAAGLLQAQSDAQSKLDALFGDKVIAKGDGFEIKRTALDESVVTIRASAAGQGRDLSPAATQRLEREVLRRLINIELLKKRATEDDRAAGQEKAEERIRLLAERAGSTNAMARQLKAVGLTLDRLRTKLIEEATSETVLERELNIEITDEQVKEYYDENPARFEKPEMVRVGHILLRTSDPMTRQEMSADEKAAKLRKIESLLKRARRGDDFAELAAEFSEDPGSKDKDGEYTFARGQTAPAFEAAAFSLTPGKISDVITTPFGYHIIKLYEKIPATALELDEKVSDDVREFLKGREVQKQMIPFMETLMKEFNVEILDDRLKPQPGDQIAPAADTASTELP